MWPVVQLYFSKMSSQAQFRWQSGYQVLPPHRAGGIYVEKSFTNSGGEIEISGSSADENGGAVLRSSSGVFGRI